MTLIKRAYLLTLFLLSMLPIAFYGQCVTDIAGPGTGTNTVCSAPDFYTYGVVVYNSTVTGPGWTYNWTISPNGTIDIGQGTSSIHVTWRSAPAGNCNGWVNLVVTDGQGCSYNYGQANGVSGKCVNVLSRPSPEYTGRVLSNTTVACLWDTVVNNYEAYTVNNPCATCNYNWIIQNGTIISGQGTSSMNARWLQRTGATLDLVVSNPNGCNATWSAEHFYLGSTTITVYEGVKPDPISGPAVAYANGCVYRYTSNVSRSYYPSAYNPWVAPGGTIVGRDVGIDSTGLYFRDTVYVVWNTTGPRRIKITNYSGNVYSCPAATSYNVNVSSGTVLPPSIQGSPQGCETGTFNYQTLSIPGVTYNWVVQNGNILSGQGTNAVQVDWTNSGLGRIIVVSSTGSCHTSDTLDVQIVSPTTFSLGPDTSNCGAPITLTGPPSMANYIWSNGASSSSTIATSSAGYWLEVTEANGCTWRDTIAVQLNNPPAFSLGPDTVACMDSIYIAVPSGFANYTWNTGATTTGIWTNTSSSYAVTITDTNGCFSADTIIATINAPTTFSLGQDTSNCGAPITLTGPPSMASYSWSNGASSSSTIATSSGDYWLEVTAANGCTWRDTIAVQLNNPPAFSLGPDTVACLDSIYIAVPSGFANYTWNTGATTTGIWTNTSSSYAVTITDTNGCFSADTINVLLTSPTPFSLGPDTSICDYSMVLTGPPGMVSYTWSNGSSADSLLATSSGTYWLEVSQAGGCTWRDTIVVQINTPPAFSLGPDTVACMDSVYIAAPSGFVNYSWNTGATTTGIWANTSSSYAVTILDTNGCTATDTIIVLLTSPTPFSLGPDTSICDYSMLLTGPPGMISYAWSNGASADSLLAASSGDYWLEVSQAGGCIWRDTIAVQLNNPPVFSLGPDIVGCLDSVYITAPSGFVNYTWSTGASTTGIWVNSTSIYSVTVEATNGCTATDEIVVLLYSPIPFSLGPDTSVCDFSMLLTGPPGMISYTWSNGANAVSTLVTSSGDYWLEVSQPGGCIWRDTIAVQFNQPPVFSLGPDTVACLDSIYVAGPSGFANYSWSTGATTAGIWANSTSSYMLSVMDINGCAATDTISVVLNSVMPNFLGNDTVICLNSLVLYGPIAQSYLWSTGETADTLAVSSTGSYWLQIVDYNGCSATDTLLISLGLPQVSIGLACPVELCSGQSVIANGPPGYQSYLWNGITPGASYLVNQSGSLELSVTDINGCVGTSAPCTVIVHQLPNAQIFITGDTLTTSPIGTYNWLMNGQSIGLSSPWIVPTVSGSFTVEVTDSFGCASLSQPVSYVHNIAPQILTLQVLPNPSNGTFRLQHPLLLNPACEVSLLDGSSRQMQFEMEIHDDELTVNATELLPGFYILRIGAGNQMVAAKVIVIQD